MRLLDCIAQSRTPFLAKQVDGEVRRLRSACDFAPELRACPLRYVLSDELTRTCSAIAYSEGHQLADFIDLLHIPAEQLWVEWSESARRDELLRATSGRANDEDLCDVVRAGALIRASRNGRSGMLTTFWTCRDRPNDPLVAALETHFDLDERMNESGAVNRLYEGAAVRLPGGDAIQACIRYRFERSWLEYYQQHAGGDETRWQVLSSSLATVAKDLPVLLALSLLFATRGGLPSNPSNLESLNTKRARQGKPPLLEHIEVSAPILSQMSGGRDSPQSTWRRAPRFHHVRGHLVRREDVVYWRAPHWRGHVRLGRIRSRNVLLK
jgi:hypothetical protein